MMAYPVAPMLAGTRFGRLVLTGRRSLHHAGGKARASWECECDCGTVKYVVGQSLPGAVISSRAGACSAKSPPLS